MKLILFFFANRYLLRDLFTYRPLITMHLSRPHEAEPNMKNMQYNTRRTLSIRYYIIDL